MAGNGTGYPNSFVCANARRSQLYDPERGRTSARLGYSYPPGHDMERTGRTKPLASSQEGKGHLRALQHRVEYRCSCGHVGWTRMKDVMRLPLAND